MPVPTPKSEDDLGECIRFLRRENPEMKQDQRVHICLSTYRKAHGIPEPKKKGK